MDYKMLKFFLRYFGALLILASIALFAYGIYFVIFYMFVGGIEGIINGIKNDFHGGEIALGIMKLFFASTVAAINTAFSALILSIGAFMVHEASDLDAKKRLKTFRTMNF